MSLLDTHRYERLDALRGLAVVWMTLFHLGFDLAWLGLWRQDFYRDALWTSQRTVIVGIFLFCAGLSQAVALAHEQPWRRFARRWAQVAGAAVLVSAGSWLVFPNSFIYFGVLHGIAVMLLVTRLAAGWGRWLWLAGAAALAASWIALWAHGAGLAPPWLNAPAFNWLGLIGRKPVTEDYVPVLPWLAAMLWGLAAGQWLLARRPQVLAGRLPRSAAWLAWIGRWSLSWYLLHQPVMLGALMLWLRLRG